MFWINGGPLSRYNLNPRKYVSFSYAFLAIYESSPQVLVGAHEQRSFHMPCHLCGMEE
jgi:hypothetical protein